MRAAAQGRRRLWPCLVLLAGALLCGPVRAAEPFDPFAAAGIEPEPDARVPLALDFTDDRGQRVTLAELFDGRPVILAPVYYRCRNVCGTQLASLFNLLSALRLELGRDYTVVAFSFDPREEPADARAERARLRKRWPQLADSRHVHFLTGSAASSAALSAAIGFRYRWDPGTEEYAHISALAILGAGGRLARWLYGLGYQPDDLRLALTDAGEGRVGSLGDRLLLLCYHYDPQRGGYDNRVIGALQVGGLGTALALGGFIGVSLWRERRRREMPHGR